MNPFGGYLILSASTLHYFTICPKLFLYYISNERFTDKRSCRSLTVNKVFSIGQLQQNIQNMSVVSLEQQLNHDITVSASSLGQFKKCPKAFHYRITGTPQTDVDISPFQFGTIVHSTMDDFYHGLQKEFGGLLKAPVRERFIDFYKSDKLREFILNKLKSAAWTESKQKVYTHFYESIKNDYILIRSILEKGCEPVFNFWFGTRKNPLEVKSVDIPRLRMIGEIDWYYINKRGNLTIEDRKTSQNTRFLDYDQLFLYAISLEQYFANIGDPRKVDELNYCLVRTGTRFPIPFGREQRESLIANLSSLETCVELNSFPAIKGKNCQRCPYYSLCTKSDAPKSLQSRDAFLSDLKKNISNRTIDFTK